MMESAKNETKMEELIGKDKHLLDTPSKSNSVSEKCKLKKCTLSKFSNKGRKPYNLNTSIESSCSKKQMSQQSIKNENELDIKETEIPKVFTNKNSNLNEFINSKEYLTNLQKSHRDIEISKRQESETSNEKARGIKESNDWNNVEMSIMDELEKKEFEILSKIKIMLAKEPHYSDVTSNLELSNLIISNKDKIFSFAEKINNKMEVPRSFSRSSICFENLIKLNWPEILKTSYFGIFYNLSKLSEEIELSNLLIVDRYIKSETLSSFQSSSSNLKRNIKLTQSSASRLSHLAKRRATFSSANLQTTSKQTASKINRRQIIFGSVKDSKPKTNPPTPKRNVLKDIISDGGPVLSSVKKNKLIGDQRPEPCKETSKRALFQSPPQIFASVQKSKPIFKPELAIRVEKSKRALFSPAKADYSEKFHLNRKLYLNTGEVNKKEENIKQHKSPYNDSTLSFKGKSHSFSVSASDLQYPSSVVNGKSLLRSRSDTFYSSHLTDSHRKKLLWAVSQALLKKKIGTSHPDFKKYVSVLAKVIKRLYLEFYRKSNSTSEILLKLSKKYVHSVLNGKTADEIYLLEKNCFQKQAPNINSISRYSLTGVSVKEHNSDVNSSSFIASNDRIRSYDPLNICGYSNEIKEKGWEFQEKHLSSNCNNTDIIQSKKKQNSSVKKKLYIESKENIYSILEGYKQNKHGNENGKNGSPYLDTFDKINIKDLVHSSFPSMDVAKAKRQISFDD